MLVPVFCSLCATPPCSSLTGRLSPPLGLGKGASSTDVLRFVFDLDIPLLNGRVPFQRTAYELVRRCSGAEIPEGILKDQVGVAAGQMLQSLQGGRQSRQAHWDRQYSNPTVRVVGTGYGSLATLFVCVCYGGRGWVCK